MKKFLKSLFVFAFVSLIISGSSYASILWYNGDFDYQNGFANAQNSAVTTYARVYDDFVVDGSGWNVNRVWSNNLIDFTAAAAFWEIRSGVSAGNAGTLIANGGGTGFFTQTPTGRNGFGYNEQMISISNINLDLVPGTYWLSVWPVGSGAGTSFISTTSGLNAVGQPAGNNSNAFWDSPFFGYNYYPTAQYQPNLRDFSMGIEGTPSGNPVVPEPASLSFLGLGLLGLFRKKLIAD